MRKDKQRASIRELKGAKNMRQLAVIQMEL